MKYDTHGNGNGLNDIYILPENDEERKKLPDIVKSLGFTPIWQFANVKGHEWYGKWFIEVPFAECHIKEIHDALQG